MRTDYIKITHENAREIWDRMESAVRSFDGAGRGATRAVRRLMDDIIWPDQQMYLEATDIEVVFLAHDLGYDVEETDLHMANFLYNVRGSIMEGDFPYLKANTVFTLFEKEHRLMVNDVLKIVNIAHPRIMVNFKRPEDGWNAMSTRDKIAVIKELQELVFVFRTTLKSTAEFVSVQEWAGEQRAAVGAYLKVLKQNPYYR